MEINTPQHCMMIFCLCAPSIAHPQQVKENSLNVRHTQSKITKLKNLLSITGDPIPALLYKRHKPIL